MRMTKIYWKRFRSPVAAAAGLLAGVALTASMAFANLYREQTAQIEVQKQQISQPEFPKSEQQPEHHEETEKPKSLLEQFEGLRIVGFLKGKNDEGQEKLYYQFTKAKRGESPTAIITSQELTVAGIGVQYFSECKAMLKYGADEKIIYCF